jgi:hypothetical protein
MNKANLFGVAVVLVLGLFQPATAQQPDAARIDKVESQVRHLETEVGDLTSAVHHLRNEAGSGAAFFLFGVVCALWAQNSGRNPWLWFFLGLFFNVITVLVMLSKNSKDRKTTPRGA